MDWSGASSEVCVAEEEGRQAFRKTGRETDETREDGRTDRQAGRNREEGETKRRSNRAASLFIDSHVCTDESLPVPPAGASRCVSSSA